MSPVRASLEPVRTPAWARFDESRYRVASAADSGAAPGWREARRSGLSGPGRCWRAPGSLGSLQALRYAVSQVRERDVPLVAVTAWVPPWR